VQDARLPAGQLVAAEHRSRCIQQDFVAPAVDERHAQVRLLVAEEPHRHGRALDSGDRLDRADLLHRRRAVVVARRIAEETAAGLRRLPPRLADADVRLVEHGEDRQMARQDVDLDDVARCVPDDVVAVRFAVRQRLAVEEARRPPARAVGRDDLNVVGRERSAGRRVELDVHRRGERMDMVAVRIGRRQRDECAAGADDRRTGRRWCRVDLNGDGSGGTGGDGVREGVGISSGDDGTSGAARRFDRTTRSDSFLN